MRIIKSITVVCQQEIKKYQVGDFINGIEIKRIVNNCQEYSDHTEVFFNCVSNLTEDNIVVQLCNVPVIVEYCEVINNE